MGKKNRVVVAVKTLHLSLQLVVVLANPAAVDFGLLLARRAGRLHSVTFDLVLNVSILVVPRA